MRHNAEDVKGLASFVSFALFLSPKLLWPIPQIHQGFRSADSLPKEASGRANSLLEPMIKHTWSCGAERPALISSFPLLDFVYQPVCFQSWNLSWRWLRSVGCRAFKERAILSHGTSCCLVSIKVSWLLHKLSSKTWHQNTKWVTFFVEELTAQLCVRELLLRLSSEGNRIFSERELVLPSAFTWHEVKAEFRDNLYGKLTPPHGLTMSLSMSVGFGIIKVLEVRKHNWKTFLSA